MTCLPDTDPAARTNGCSGSTCGRFPRAILASRRYASKFDERWRETISSTVLSGQESGEFERSVDADVRGHPFGPLDGMAVQIALEDPDVPPARAYDLAMRFAAGPARVPPGRRQRAVS